MSPDPMFILVENYNYTNTLKMWLCDPPVFFILFIWILATVVSIKIYDAKPFKWVLVLTILLLIFRVFPMKTHPEPVSSDQATQITTQVANMNASPLPSVAPPLPFSAPTPRETPSAQLITN